MVGIWGTSPLSLWGAGAGRNVRKQSLSYGGAGDGKDEKGQILAARGKLGQVRAGVRNQT